MTHNDDLFVRNLKRRFDASVDELDASILSRIRQTRSRVLDKKTGAGRNYIFWIPAGAFTSVFMALFIYSNMPQKTQEDQTFVDEIDIISNLELYENLEFYEWLEQHELPS